MSEVAMECPKCRTENPDTARFCAGCGMRLGPAATPLRDSPTRTLSAQREELGRGTLFAGRYEVIEALGAGGMGEVYRVEDKTIGHEVALKLIRPEIAATDDMIERFRRELTTTRMIAHRNVCRMFDLGEGRGTFFITMEYVAGEDLKCFMRRSAQLAVGTAIRIARQICAGLAEAHRLGVVHRDLKPSNIMIDKEGNAKIMDFGIARSLHSKSITGEGSVIGTPEYMSPEQAEGEEADRRSDLYSLGIILYEMVTGKVPFEGMTPLSLAMKHKLEAPRNPQELVAQLPDDLSALILKCLEKDRAKRYQDAEELDRELEQIAKGTAIEGPPPARSRPLVPTGTARTTAGIKGKRAVLLGGIAFLLVLAALAGRLIFGGRGEVLDSIAVLPFENETADPETDYLCDGITESLINKLSQLSVFKKVISRASSFAFKGVQVDPKSAGRKLGVKTVLVTRMLRRGETISISPALIRTSDDSQLWGERYRVELRDIFAVEEGITSAIVSALKLKITGAEKGKISTRQINDVQAYEFYLKAKREIGLWTKDGCDRALQYLEKGQKILGENALIDAGIGYVYYSYANLGLEGEVNGQKAELYARKALALEPESPEAHLVLGLVNSAFLGDQRNAVDHLKKALAANPFDGDVLWWLGITYDFTGQAAAAERMARSMSEFDPLNPQTGPAWINVHHYAGRLDRAFELLSKDPPRDPPGLFDLAWFVVDRKGIREAEDLVEAHIDDPRTNVMWQLYFLLKYAARGDRESFSRQLTPALTYTVARDPQYSSLMADFYALLGDPEKALDWLEIATSRGFINYPYLNRDDPYLRTLRSTARFKDLMEKIKPAWEQFGE